MVEVRNEHGISVKAHPGLPGGIRFVGGGDRVHFIICIKSGTLLGNICWGE